MRVVGFWCVGCEAARVRSRTCPDSSGDCEQLAVALLIGCFGSMSDYTFHPEFVNPSYLELMNMNFLRTDIEVDAERLFERLLMLSNRASDALVVTLLHDTWRPSKVGAWLIAIGDKQQLVGELIDYLGNRHTYPEHVISALALASPTRAAEPIYHYANQEISRFADFLRWREWDRLERGNINIAVHALHYLSDFGGAELAHELTSSSAWANVMEFLDRERRPGSTVDFTRALIAHPDVDALHRAAALIHKVRNNAGR